MALRVGIIGGGVGGLVAAIALRAEGHEPLIFEQTARYGRVGADINLTPNAVHVLDRLGVGEALRRTAARPTHRISRTWDTGAVTSSLEMADTAQDRYGAPQLTIHRADLLGALEEQLPPGAIRLGAKVSGIRQSADDVGLVLASGEGFGFDVIIGADGIHSMVRTTLFGPEHPTYTGLVAYRAVVPRDKLPGVSNLDAFTKWWGPSPDSQIVTFPLNRGQDIFVFATIAKDDWAEESWTQPGDPQDIKTAYAGFHPEARALVEACGEVMCSALHIRDPLARWSQGRVTLLGDACHPMTPFMAQGACMAIEDGVVLARCLDGVTPDSVPAALVRYETTRRERTARVQIGSRGNEWLRDGGNADWLYGYDAWTVPLAA
jgi:salicylate hydroxylase